MYFKRNIGGIRIITGDACNCNCRYCIQHDMISMQQECSYNPEICEFIKSVIQESENIGKFDISFTGGEPFLYFNILKKFILDMQDVKDKVSFRVITNGKLLNDEIIDFCNCYDIVVQISWDGYNSSYTRNYDVVADKKYELFKINNLRLHATFCNGAYPFSVIKAFQDFDNEYSLFHEGNHIGTSACPLRENGTSDNVFEYDLGKLYSEMKAVVYNYYRNIEFRNEYPILKEWLEKLMREVSMVAESDDKITFNNRNCLDGIKNYNMDFAGNLYPCHSWRKKCGDIHSNYFDYLYNFIQCEKKSFDFSKCDSCVVKHICRGGCKLTLPFQQEHYCAVSIAAYKGFMEYLADPTADYFKIEV